MQELSRINGEYEEVHLNGEDTEEKKALKNGSGDRQSRNVNLTITKQEYELASSMAVAAGFKSVEEFFTRWGLDKARQLHARFLSMMSEDDDYNARGKGNKGK